LGGPVNIDNTIILGANLSVVPTAINQIYTYPGLSNASSGSFLIHDSGTGQIGRYTGLTIDIDGFIFSDDVWMNNKVLYLGEKLPIADQTNGLKTTTLFGGITLDGVCLFGYDGGLLGTTKTTDKATFKWDDSQLATFYGNIELPYTNASGTSGIITFGASGARLIVPTDATSSFYGGVGAGKLGSTGAGNVGFGYQSLTNCTTGANNACYGYQTGTSLVGGYCNIFIGYGAGTSIVGGYYNTLIGYNSGVLLGGSVTNNTAIGRETLASCTAGIENTAIGSRALYTNIATGNTALGFEAGFNNTSGTGNTYIGYKAGYTNADGINNLALGANTNVGVSGSARTAIGYGAVVSGNNQMVLGDIAVCVGIRTTNPTTALYVNGDITCTGSIDGVDIGTLGRWVNQDVTSGSYPNFNNIRDMTMSGFDSWALIGTVYSIDPIGSPLHTFRLLIGGTGYIKSRRVLFFAPQDVQFVANTSNYIYVNSSGLLNITSTPTSSLYDDNIVLYELFYDGISSPFLKKENHPYKFQTSISRYFHANVGNIIQGEGAIISRVGTGVGTMPDDIQVKISGEDIVNDHGLQTVISDSGGLAISVKYFYRDLNPISATYGKWLQYYDGTDTPLYYNNGASGPTALAVGEYSIMRIYVCQDDINTSIPTYIAVIDENVYASQVLAEAAITNGSVITPTNELESMEPCQLGYIVITLVSVGPTVGNIASTIVQKKTFTAQYGGGSGSSSHLLLSDLNGGQYSDGGHSSLTTTAEFATPPTVDDDIDAYKNGSIWLDTAGYGMGREIYMCVNNADGTAIWNRIAWSNHTEITIGPSAKAVTGGISIGSGTGAALTSGTGQVAIGYNAGSTVQSGNNGVFIGYNADGTTAGVSQIAIGASSTSLGDYSVALGSGAKAGTDCISIGQLAGSSITSATGSIYQGYHAGMQYTTGTNICIGYYSGYNSTVTLRTTTGCVIIGENAGYYAYGNSNTYIGKNVGYTATYRSVTGIGNTGIGYNAGIGDDMNYITTIGYSAHAKGGDYGIAIGTNSYASGMAAISIGGGGTEAAAANAIANYSVAIGSDCICSSQWGVCIGMGSITGTGQNCILIGTNNGISGTGAGDNIIAIGNANLDAITTAQSNIVMGFSNLKAITVARGNLVFGYNNCTILDKSGDTNYASYNYVFGANCMQLATYSRYNCIYGYTAAAALTTGNENIIMGLNSAASITTGSNNICIGSSSDCSSTNSNQISIGTSATCTGSYGIAIGSATTASAKEVVIGSSDITMYKYNGFNTYIVQPATLLNYNIGTPATPKFTITIPTTTPWHAKINLIVSENTTNIVAETSFDATGGHGSGGVGANIIIGNITQCGSLNAQLDTITGTSATIITVEKTTNFTSNPTAYKLKIYIEMHFGTVSAITRTEGSIVLFP
jgi:hypothetical protein